MFGATGRCPSYGFCERMCYVFDKRVVCKSFDFRNCPRARGQVFWRCWSEPSHVTQSHPHFFVIPRSASGSGGNAATVLIRKVLTALLRLFGPATDPARFKLTEPEQALC